MFCPNCGKKLKDTENFCTGCGTPMRNGQGRNQIPAGKGHSGRKRKQKKPHSRRKAVLWGVILLVLLALGATGAYLLLHQEPPVIHDQTQEGSAVEDGGNDPDENQPAGSGGDGGEDNEAVMSSNVKPFLEESAAEINQAITNVEITNKGMFLRVNEGTALDALGIGDIFYLDGTEETPLGQPFIGKIAGVSNRDGTVSYQIETPMIDEVFDVLDVQCDQKLEVQDIARIETVEGVTVTMVDDFSDADFFDSGPETLAASLLSRQQERAVVVPLTEEKNKLLMGLDVDLLKVFGLGDKTENGKAEQYEYSAGNWVTVYANSGSLKYHKENCHYLNDDRKELTLREAEEGKYTPCRICTPPVMKDSKGVLHGEEPELKLFGQIGLEEVDFYMDLDWDIFRGKGLEKFAIGVCGDFVAKAGLKVKLEAELGGEKTGITIPAADVKLSGLNEKLFPVAFLTYKAGVIVPVTLPGKEGVRAMTSAVPLTVGAIVYVDINGNFSMEGTLTFSYNYNFNCSYTAVENGKFVNIWDTSGNPTCQTELSWEGAVDVDFNTGVAVSAYIFNLNVAEVNVVKPGVEADGKVKIEYKSSRESLLDGEPVREGAFEASYHVRGYVKLFEVNMKLLGKVKVLGFNLSKSYELHECLLDFTIVEFGERTGQRFSSVTMEYSPVTAKDGKAIYYKDTDGRLIREEKGYHTVLYDTPFYAICGIDETYIYLTAAQDKGYQVIRVSKKDGISRKILDNVSQVLMMGEEVMYYVCTDTPDILMELDRTTLKESTFAKFDHDVTFMVGQGDDFYVATLKSDLISSWFGSTVYYYLLDEYGNVLEDYGSDPEVTEYHLEDNGTYYSAERVVSYGDLRSSAKTVCWMSKDKSSNVEAKGTGGWVMTGEGIFTNQEGEDAASLQLILYRASDGGITAVTDVESKQAMFTISKSDAGDWFFFDQTEENMILYTMPADFSSKQVVKTFPRDDFPCDLEECGAKLMNNRIYFYTMPDNATCEMLYWYDIA